MTNRALVLAALAAGPAEVRHPLRARDTLLMAGALRALGVRVDTADPAAWPVTPGWASQDTRVDVGNAGTVIRFVPPVAALTSVAVEFRGDPAAARRPVARDHRRAARDRGGHRRRRPRRRSRSPCAAPARSPAAP